MLKRCKPSVAVVIAVAAVFASAISGDVVAREVPKIPGWQLFWHDEFDADSLNSKNWEAMDRQNSFNNEKQFYRPEQVSVIDGNLQITATNQPMAKKRYRSGLITSKGRYDPGRFEARIHLPTTQGMWPAFWLNANQLPWPRGGEIDIMENKGSQPTITSSAFHWQKDRGPCCADWHFVTHAYTATSGGSPINFTTGFHIFAIEWDKNPTSKVSEIRYYVDGHLHYVVDQTSAMADINFTTAKNIILNLAVGGDFGGDPNGTTVFPQTMLVDYVRVWHRSTSPSGNYNGNGHTASAQ